MENLDTADCIDENSILAPLSQRNDLPCSQINLKTPATNNDTLINNESTVNHHDNDDAVFDDSDDDLLNNFSMNFDPNETFKVIDK